MFSVKDVQSTAKNLQSNLICEQIHQTLENVLRTVLYSNPPQNMTQARDIIDQALATAMHATRKPATRAIHSAATILGDHNNGDRKKRKVHFGQTDCIRYPVVLWWASGQRAGRGLADRLCPGEAGGPR